MRSELLSRAIWQLKYRNAPDIAGPLGDHLAWAAGSCGILPARDSVVVAVPLHTRRERERGYNQADLLARRFAAIAMLPCLSGVLTRIRHTASQVEAPDRATRFENMTGAFVCTVPQSVRGRAVILIDDVSTTGATMEEAARALKAAGARSVTGVVLARG
jgi:ComF family protein